MRLGEEAVPSMGPRAGDVTGEGSGDNSPLGVFPVLLEDDDDDGEEEEEEDAKGEGEASRGEVSVELERSFNESFEFILKEVSRFSFFDTF